jgi:hypothetical protein
MSYKCKGESDDVADDDMLSKCNKEQNESSVKFVGCGFSEKRKQNE